MQVIRYTLLAEGSSDTALMPILNWLWAQHRPRDVVEGSFADLEYNDLQSRSVEYQIGPAIDLFPCDYLFVHRDADRESLETRRAQVKAAIQQAACGISTPPAVCVIPVRMTEAWMLFDATAIRKAADNPNGTDPLDIPKLAKVESLPDPKDTLARLLKTASELPPQCLRRFRVARAAQLVTLHITDFSPLRQLPSFRSLEEDFIQTLR